MNHYLLRITYNGAPFSGWQRLADQPNTIQQLIENALSSLLHESILIHGSGRTDAKVHACNQYADFFCQRHLDSSQSVSMVQQLNQILPADIRIHSIQAVDHAFHSRKSAIDKTYQYHISLNQKSDVFNARYSFQPYDLMLPEQVLRQYTDQQGNIQLDEAAMQNAASLLIGKHDFSSYTTDKSKEKSHVRVIDAIELSHHTTESGKQDLILTFTGNGFLYNMVRILAGTLLYVGLGQIAPNEIPHITEAGKRELAGPTLPAHALFLFNVRYHAFDQP